MEIFGKYGLIGALVGISVLFVFKFYLHGYWAKFRLNKKVRVGDTIEFSNGFEAQTSKVIAKKLTYIVLEDGTRMPNGFISSNPVKVIK